MNLAALTEHQPGIEHRLGELVLPEIAKPTPQELADLVQSLGLRPELWHDKIRFDPDSRYYARLGRTETYEVWLLTWLPGQATGLHDHGDSAGAFTVVGGILRERTPVALGSGKFAIREQHLPSGAVRSFAPGYLNEIVASTTPSISVHAYGPALTTMRQFAFDAGRLVPVGGEHAHEREGVEHEPMSR